MKGIQDLIRPCATLARYEAALAAGTITQDVMVFIADVRQIRWKGEIYDCSVTAVTEDGKTYIHADGLNDSGDGYYFLPSSAPGDDPAHTFAMLSDLEGLGGGGDTEELEEVSAGALCELNSRVKAQDEATQNCVKKTDFESYAEKASEQAQNSEVIVVSALIDLNKRVNELFDRLNRIESR